MKVPNYLDAEARTFWKKHAKRLNDAGILTDFNADSFALTCRVWSLMASTDPHQDSKQAMKFNGLLKHFMALAKPFGLLPGKPPATTEAKNLDDAVRRLTDA